MNCAWLPQNKNTCALSSRVKHNARQWQAHQTRLYRALPKTWEAIRGHASVTKTAVVGVLVKAAMLVLSVSTGLRITRALPEVLIAAWARNTPSR